MSVVYLKTYSLDAINRIAKDRPPGYLDDILRMAVSKDDKSVVIEYDVAASISGKYAGTAIKKKPTKRGCRECNNKIVQQSAKNIVKKTTDTTVSIPFRGF